ncbi:zinc-specific metallo-regulatory protein [Collibacillus ludicampi]|uniref:Zinc-specific metallo-regulatory protein n=1 Tax=Collibacillus ludicampi TaxID=2771369 RepID=A0AAV4LDF1_9BACL|nr:transcriptional repressor [Collibacillus ludicampi]GIM45447.1 zinc-specific metallo-regulatory protein [Collibacillus ludicampi]
MTDVEAYLSKLRAQGFKLTGKRRAIVEVLLREDRYITAKDLMEALKESYPSLSLDTVYRNLNMLKEAHIIEESEYGEGGSRYRIRCSTDHHHHLVCIRCGKTEALEDCPMDILAHVPEGYQVVGHRFEVLGYCPGCTDDLSSKGGREV